MKHVGIVGATGYTGLECIRLILQHPTLQISKLFARSDAGHNLKDIYPHLGLSMNCETYSPEKLEGLDGLFLALPHGKAHEFVSELPETDLKIVDLSADFRIKDIALYEKTYGETHAAPGLVPLFVPGFSELYRDELKLARYCSNPGCYPTSVVLALHPLRRSGKKLASVIVDAKSGITGAGKTPIQVTHFCEANEAITAYKTFEHRHGVEMMDEINVPIAFSPHRVPMMRGILSAVYVTLDESVSKIELDGLYSDCYDAEPFVHYLPNQLEPSTQTVKGSNNCVISIKQLNETQFVIFSAIDNLIKGASGQGIQNMNIMLGLNETDGLPTAGHYF